MSDPIGKSYTKKNTHPLVQINELNDSMSYRDVNCFDNMQQFAGPSRTERNQRFNSISASY